MSYIVIRDTRERSGHGWTFKKYDTCLGQQIDTLKTGDYTLRGFENVLAIERKGRVTEFINNLGQKRFYAELDRLELIPFSFVICEFTMEDLIKFPEGSGISPYKWRYIKLTGKVALKLLIEIQMKYKTKFLFCGSKGQIVASSIFKRVVERANEWQQEEIDE